MYSQMVQGMAAERTKDLRREAAAAAQARLARSALAGQASQRRGISRRRLARRTDRPPITSDRS